MATLPLIMQVVFCECDTKESWLKSAGNASRRGNTLENWNPEGTTKCRGVFLCASKIRLHGGYDTVFVVPDRKSDWGGGTTRPRGYDSDDYGTRCLVLLVKG